MASSTGETVISSSGGSIESTSINSITRTVTIRAGSSTRTSIFHSGTSTVIIAASLTPSAENTITVTPSSNNTGNMSVIIHSCKNTAGFTDTENPTVSYDTIAVAAGACSVWSHNHHTVNSDTNHLFYKKKKKESDHDEVISSLFVYCVMVI